MSRYTTIECYYQNKNFDFLPSVLNSPSASASCGTLQYSPPPLFLFLLLWQKWREDEGERDEWFSNGYDG